MENIYQPTMRIDPSCTLGAEVGHCEEMQSQWNVNRLTGGLSDGYIIKAFYPDVCPPPPSLGCWLRADNEEAVETSTEIYDQLQMWWRSSPLLASPS